MRLAQAATKEDGKPYSAKEREEINAAFAVEEAEANLESSRKAAQDAEVELARKKAAIQEGIDLDDPEAYAAFVAQFDQAKADKAKAKAEAK